MAWEPEIIRALALLEQIAARRPSPVAGCICPILAEQTCQSQLCPRRRIAGLTIGASMPPSGTLA